MSNYKHSPDTALSCNSSHLKAASLIKTKGGHIAECCPDSRNQWLIIIWLIIITMAHTMIQVSAPDHQVGIEPSTLRPSECALCQLGHGRFPIYDLEHFDTGDNSRVRPVSYYNHSPDTTLYCQSSHCIAWKIICY